MNHLSSEKQNATVMSQELQGTIKTLREQIDNSAQENDNLRSEIVKLSSQLSEREQSLADTIATYNETQRNTETSDIAKTTQFNELHLQASNLSTALALSQQALQEKSCTILNQASTIEKLNKTVELLNESLVTNTAAANNLTIRNKELQSDLETAKQSHETEVKNLRSEIQKTIANSAEDIDKKESKTKSVFERIKLIADCTTKQNIFICANNLRRIQRIEGRNITQTRMMMIQEREIVEQTEHNSSDSVRRHMEEELPQEETVENSTGAVSGRGCLTLMASGPTSCSEVADNYTGNVSNNASGNFNHSLPVTVVARSHDIASTKNLSHFFLFFFFSSPVGGGRKVPRSAFVTPKK